MTIAQGQDLLIRIGDAPNPLTCVYHTLALVTDSRIVCEETREYRHLTVASGLWETRPSPAGQRSVQLWIRGIYDTAAAERWLMHYALSATSFPLEIQFSTTHKMIGMGICTSFERTSTHNQPERYDAQLVFASDVSYAAV
jgi:Phage tail tube protein